MSTYEDVVIDTSRTSYPVVRRTSIGEKIVVGLLKEEWRNLQRKDTAGNWVDVLKDDGKTPRKQAVITALVKESTMPAASGGNEHVPVRGEIVRLMFDGGAASQWIDAKKALDGQFKVGVLIAMNTTHAVRYSTNGFKELGRIDTQPELDAWYQSDANLRRQESVGKRGDIALRDADSDPQFKGDCLKAYHEEINRPADVPLGDPFPSSGAGPSDLF